MIKFASKGEDPHRGMYLTSVVNKEIMSRIRKGDYQHAGEEEAIELIFQQVTKNHEHWLLDVGCGFGGTADYVQKNGWGKVIGIDINKEIIDIAIKKHGYSIGNQSLLNMGTIDKTPLFLHCDVIESKRYFETSFSKFNSFDIIYSLNSFFLFPDQIMALKNLAALAKKTSKLLIFDYIDYGNYKSCAYSENGKLLYPNIIHFNRIYQVCNAAGWSVESIQKIDVLYVKWYRNLMDKINENKADYTQRYGQEAFDCFIQRYQHILDVLVEGVLGGAIITLSLS